MARAATATLDGLVVGYGARDTLNPQAGSVHTLGNTDKELVVVIDHTNYLPFATSTAVTGGDQFGLPAGAKIRAVRAEIKEAFADLTSIVVGMKIAAGTTVDADGLIASTLLAALTPAGETIEGAGALVNGAALAAESFVSLDVTGTAPTAGRMEIIVQYDMPSVSQDAPAVITGEI